MRAYYSNPVKLENLTAGRAQIAARTSISLGSTLWTRATLTYRRTCIHTCIRTRERKKHRRERERRRCRGERIKKYLTGRRHARARPGVEFPTTNGWNENYTVDIIKRGSYGDPKVIWSAGSKSLMTVRVIPYARQQRAVSRAYTARISAFPCRRDTGIFPPPPSSAFAPLEYFLNFFPIRSYPETALFCVRNFSPRSRPRPQSAFPLCVTMVPAFVTYVCICIAVRVSNMLSS